jgi:hypothetical protein
MNPWMRRLHLVLTIGGGFLGFVLSLQMLFNQREANAIAYLLFAGFVGFYAFAIYIGFRLAEDPRVTPSLVAFYWLQVPWVSSPLFAWRLSVGFHLSAGLIGGQFSGTFRLGSEWQFSLLRPAPWGLGLNIFALVMAIVVTRQLLAAAKPPAPPASAVDPATPPLPPLAPPSPPPSLDSPATSSPPPPPAIPSPAVPTTPPPPAAPPATPP